jgi:hypothetical protein
VEELNTQRDQAQIEFQSTLLEKMKQQEIEIVSQLTIDLTERLDSQYKAAMDEMRALHLEKIEALRFVTITFQISY